MPDRLLTAGLTGSTLVASFLLAGRCLERPSSRALGAGEPTLDEHATASRRDGSLAWKHKSRELRRTLEILAKAPVAAAEPLIQLPEPTTDLDARILAGDASALELRSALERALLKAIRGADCPAGDHPGRTVAKIGMRVRSFGDHALAEAIDSVETWEGSPLSQALRACLLNRAIGPFRLSPTQGSEFPADFSGTAGVDLVIGSKHAR